VEFKEKMRLDAKAAMNKEMQKILNTVMGNKEV
jgi:hypothetical protein